MGICSERAVAALSSDGRSGENWGKKKKKSVSDQQAAAQWSVEHRVPGGFASSDNPSMIPAYPWAGFSRVHCPR